MTPLLVIDAHVHLWESQIGLIDGRKVFGVGGGKSNFGGEIRQMMNPCMDDNKNTVERLIANMDYARVAGCVVTQEYIDGNQNDYLQESQQKYPERIKICALYEENDNFELNGFDGLKICASRLKDRDLTKLIDVFQRVEKAGKFISIDMAPGEEQVSALDFIAKECPDLRIAIGHFGMVTYSGWQKQIQLAKHKNVYIESGGLTWLFHKEFYPYYHAMKAVREAADICGINKLMWGSDYPRTMTDITYIMAVRFILESVELSIAEKRLFLGENAASFYKFSNIHIPKEINNML